MGDLRNSTERLQKLLKTIQFPNLHIVSLQTGAVKDLLQIVHYALLDYSRPVAQFIQSSGYDMYGKTDMRFIESAFRLLRNEFRYFPTLNPTQFLSEHFVERKLNLVSDIVSIVIKKHEEMQWLQRQQDAVWSKPKESKKRDVSVENHLLPPGLASHAKTILDHFQHQSAAAMRKEPLSTTTASYRKGSPWVKRRGDSRDRDTQKKLENQLDHVNNNMHDSGISQEKNVRFQTDRADEAPCPSGNQMHDSDEKEQLTETNTSNDSRQNQPPALSPPVSTTCNCKCAANAIDMNGAMTMISRQIAGLSDAILGKLSAVEDRLNRLETQMHTVVEASRHEQQQQQQTEQAQLRGDTLYNATHELMEKRTRFQADSCSWPPEPSVFERH